MAIPKGSERAFDSLPTPGADHDRLEIPGSSFPGLASLFPEGLRTGSVVSFEGSAGGGVTRLVGEVMAWASNYVGLCALVDTTGCVGPGFLLSLGIHPDRLVVFRIPSAERNRRLTQASGLENASSKPNVTTSPEYHQGPSAKIFSETESKSVSVLGLLVESFSVVAIVSLSGSQPIPHDSHRLARLLAKLRKNRTLLVSGTLEPSVTVPSIDTSLQPDTSLQTSTSLQSRTPSGALAPGSGPDTSKSRLHPQMFYPKKSRQAGTAFAVSLRNVAWFHDSSGLLYRRLIEARVVHRGMERSLLLEDGAHLERLVPAGTALGEQPPFRLRTASPWSEPPEEEQMAGSSQLRATS